MIDGSGTLTAVVFSGTVTELIGSSVGAWLTGVTRTVKERENVPTLAPPVGPLSVTVMVIVAMPLMLAVGVKLSVPVALGLV